MLRTKIYLWAPSAHVIRLAFVGGGEKKETVECWRLAEAHTFLVSAMVARARRDWNEIRRQLEATLNGRSENTMKMLVEDSFSLVNQVEQHYANGIPSLIYGISMNSIGRNEALINPENGFFDKCFLIF